MSDLVRTAPGHAAIAPSGLARTVQCNGWLQMAAKFPEPAPTEESLEGDAAHWVALMMARVQRDGIGAIPCAGQRAPNGVIIDEEMIDAGHVYLEALEGLPGVGEQAVKITRVHEHQCWGTPDFWQYSPVTKRLRVVDFKYGHRYVEVFANWQLMAYAAGIMEEVDGIDEDQIALELVIVQPRNFHKDGPIRAWGANGRLKATSLRTYINEAYDAAYKALMPNPETRTGPECRDCPARHGCDTLRKAAYNAVDVAGDTDVSLHDAGDIGRELRILHLAQERLKARVTGLEEQAIAKLKAGSVVPFYKLDETKPRQGWDGTVDDIMDMVSLVSPDVADKIVTRKLCTPKQAIKAGIDATVIAQYATNPRGTLKLAPDSLSTASKVFS